MSIGNEGTDMMVFCSYDFLMLGAETMKKRKCSLPEIRVHRMRHERCRAVRRLW